MTARLARTTTLLGALAAAAAAAGLALAAPAAGHVTVTGPDATAGHTAVLTFLVPTESASAGTTGLTVQLPPATPLATVLVAPHPGWTVRTTRTRLATPVTTDDGDTVTEAVTEITWTADTPAAAIPPGGFDQFVIDAGPLPARRTLTVKAIQTYSDGSVVRWIETPAPGSSTEPAHPAPVLTLATRSPGSTGAAPPAATGRTRGSTGAVVLSLTALVVAATALGLGVLGRARAGDR